MKTRIIILLLATSIAFNIFFAMGYYEAKEYIQLSNSYEGRSKIFADKLRLSEEQQAEFAQLQKEMSEKRAQQRENNLELYDKFWQEILKDEPDQEFLEEFVATTSSSNVRQNFVERMQSLMKILNPEQRELAVEMIKSRFQSNVTKPQSEASPPPQQ
ncbi:MAG: hypothetical protein JXA52_02240 [Planctomycetes bacterium]|nr:hypothetical protein [Planctomycetota bacterium]